MKELRPLNPSTHIRDIVSLIGKQWRELSASQKTPYDDLAKQDVIRFENEMKEAARGSKIAESKNLEQNSQKITKDLDGSR